MEREPERKGDLEAWPLQFEYVAWRREQGLEPDPTRLNQWEQAMDRIGDRYERQSLRRSMSRASA